ncbi:hypothetical protein SAMN02787144_1007321 [Streptomyces atratus]|uniref:Uncharacterized protein n=1 Tax=Streptomyces atratus TaxID=1893 RepID=A0A1K2AY04_STRAR|nr:hypothetical protein SAMN02787144_1007321 [Streptomyces atratus]
MTQDVIALTPQTPDTKTLLAGLLAGRERVRKEWNSDDDYRQPALYCAQDISRPDADSSGVSPGGGPP